jgi:hypothetical protein
MSETKTFPTYPTDDMWEAFFLHHHANDSVSEIRFWEGDFGNFAASYAAMRSAAPASVEGWQPIETAPKDGEQILTYSPMGRCSVRIWGEGDDGEMAWLPRIRGCFPTHWQPLPEPPKEQSSHE